MTILPVIDAHTGALTEIFKDLHAHPELGFEEHRTSGLVAEALRAYGVDEVHTGIAGTGVVGLIKGNREGARRIGLRADMDALPIDERSNLAYASKTPGVMHACGHDAHTTMLLEAAADIVGAENISGSDEPATGSEDFAAMLHVVPGAYCRVGHAGTTGLHNPSFTLDTSILPVGASIMARIVERRLAA